MQLDSVQPNLFFVLAISFHSEAPNQSDGDKKSALGGTGKGADEDAEVAFLGMALFVFQCTIVYTHRVVCRKNVSSSE